MSSDNTNEDTDDSGTAEASTPSAEASMPSVKKSWYKRPLGAIVLVIVVLAIGAAAFTTLTGQDNTDSEGQADRDAADQDSGGGSAGQDGEGDAGSPRSVTQQTDGADVAIVPLDLASEITRSGTFLVGVDIAPGTWISTGTDENDTCRFSVYRDASLSRDSRIRTYGGSPVEKSAIVRANQYFDTNGGCGGWELDRQGSPPAEPLTSTTRGSGTFLVGVDIAPGTWISTGTNENDTCRFSVYRDASLSDESLIRTYRGSPVEKSAIVRANQYFDTNGGCGGWELNDQGSPPAEPLTSTTRSYGTYLVGVDIAPGTWISTGTDENDYCAFLVYRDASLSDESLIRTYGGSPVGKRVTLQTNQYFDTNGECGGWELDRQGSPPAEPLTSTTRGSGTYLVGVDIAPGTWISTGTNENDTCRFSVYRDASISYESLIHTYRGSPVEKSAIVRANQYFDTNGGCGGWELNDQGSPPAEPLTSTTRSYGTYLVGVDIAPGTWISTGTDENDYCAFLVYRDASLSDESLIRTYGGSPVGKRVTLQTNQYFTTGDECGGWELDRQGSPPAEPLTSTTRSYGTYLVGVDIAPGTWISTGTDENDYCAFRVYRDASLSDESLIRTYRGSPVGKRVTLQTNQYFDTNGECGGWELNDQGSPPAEPLTSTTRSYGTYLVGVDIAPGTWISTGTNENDYCAFLVYRDASLSDESLIHTYRGSPVGKRVTLQTNQYFTTGDECGGWELNDQGSPPAEPLTSITRGSGTYLVGVDIAPGTWISTGTNENDTCRFSVYRDAPLSDESLIRTYRGSPVGKSAIVRANQYFYTNDGCGGWELEDS